MRSLLLAVLALSLLSSCGFRPRGGSVTENSDPGAIFVDAERNVSLSADLRSALRERAFTIASNRDSATILLRITGENQSQRIISVRSTGRVSEFELSHAVNMKIAQSIADERPEYDDQQAANRVEVVREYTYDDRGVLGKEDEATILRGEMREELIRQIVLRTIASLASGASS